MVSLPLLVRFMVAPVAMLGFEPEFITDSMTDDELRAYRDSKVVALRQLESRTSPEKTPDGTRYEIFYCTIYYTPKESGFTAEKGFDDTPSSAPGLGGHEYPRDFLKAVKKEGFGRISEPVKGRSYIRYAGKGRYAFAKEALGSRGNVLEPRRSAAVSTRNRYLKQRMKLLIDSPELRAVMGTTEWEVCDVGGGVHPLQIDLYWGEDEPMGPIGRQRARPSGTRMEYAFDVQVTVQ
jgi:hypothetical protein